MKTILITLMLTVSALAWSNEKGNGGSGSEAQLAAEQAVLTQVSQKIKRFFLTHEAELKEVFPLVSVALLVDKINEIRIEVTNDILVDKDDATRTCLNFPQSSLIECNYEQLQKMKADPKTVFVLMLHELLGLLGVEETSPSNPNFIDGYKVSKSIAPFVAKVSEYDLVMAPTPLKMRKQGHRSSGDISAKDYYWNVDGSLVIIKPTIFYDGAWRDIEATAPKGVCRKISHQFGLDLPAVVGVQMENEGHLFSRYNVSVTNEGKVSGHRLVQTLTIFTEVVCGPANMEGEMNAPDYYKTGKGKPVGRRGLFDL